MIEKIINGADCFYRTYEGLKLRWMTSRLSRFRRFYRTYEGLKRFL
ncbi:hypothetical protein GTCCBUS3UF5_4090 [Geobacillus thermoleovorans CCB_US3_UF5]|uniref:Uncharacterized protein n=1 Tax=Geobacillus thermoleovorans CCB_US3_UF5 TaxID=1111068 RepID=A0ABM5MDI1_GEOTH|nr:hypothetical protein GTCCBUS3UF5_4090 [Geobacillus thermoleovorans CCB_US3_UF5]